MPAGEDNVIRGGFSALGHAGSDAYVGLELIPLEFEMRSIVFNSDEFTAVCPVTDQPDLYDIEIALTDPPCSIESKSLKIYLQKFRNQGAFVETLAGKIKTDIVSAFDERDFGGAIFHDDQITVTITQKRRGGIEIEASA